MTTPMGNASGLAEEGFVPGTYSHAASGITYQIVKQQGAIWLLYDRPGDKNLHGRQKLEYFMGSGNHARTYLYSINGYWFETPIAYYSEKGAYDMRPSLQAAREMPFNLPQNFECMRCHMNGAQIEDPGTRNHYAGLPFLHGGIACQDCHGDSSAHVASGGRTAILRIANLEPDRQVAICMLCHLEGDVSVQHRGRSLANYKPGDKIGDYVSYFVKAGAEASNRGVSQVEGLYLSKCKQVSGPQMSCVTCHDPHSSPASQGKAAFYRAKCLACHSESKYTTTHYITSPDCTSCHMPKRETPDLAHSAWTDHRILAHADAPRSGLSGESDELTPVSGLMSGPTARDTALAYYHLAANVGDNSAAEKAWSLLSDVVKTNPDDPDVLAALGFLSYLRGDRQRAAELYRSALSFDPNNFNVGIDLGVVLASTQQPKLAAGLWADIFDKNEDITQLGMNIARLQCSLGQRDKAASALRSVLIYSPDHAAARTELEQMQAGTQACPPSSSQK
jgi:predicted CXXCH cytochrome family protein